MSDRTTIKKIIDIIDRRIKRERILWSGYGSPLLQQISEAIQDELLYLRKEITEEYKID